MIETCLYIAVLILTADLRVVEVTSYPWNSGYLGFDYETSEIRELPDNSPPDSWVEVEERTTCPERLPATLSFVG